VRRRSILSKLEDEPERIAENDKGESEMAGEPVLADIDPVDETAFHHVPAERALKAAQ
jgi:hypothetical protein